MDENRDVQSESRARRNRIFKPGSFKEFQRVEQLLRKETIGGMILVIVAAIGIFLANSSWSESYFLVRDMQIGPESLHLNLSVGTWAADGLLAIFFFLVGLELKHEFVAGDLRDIRQAIVPIVAAFGGVAIPALIYVGFNIADPEATRGWAIPSATDIAFAVAVLGIIGSNLPPSLRIFLLTLAVMDDLIAIAIIALFYSTNVQLLQLGFALIPIAVYGILANRFQDFFIKSNLASWLILLPLGIIAWYFMHASGIHATIAGVALGLVVPAQLGQNSPHEESLSVVMEHRYRLLSTLLAVPVFAFFSAGVNVGGVSGLLAILSSTAALGVLFGLVLGKPIGIMGAVYLLTKFTKARLDDTIKWIDLLGVSALAGIGFTVAMLVAELSFPGNIELMEACKAAIMIASVTAAVVGALILAPRNKRYKQIAAVQMADDDCDGVPNMYDAAPKDPTRS